MPARQRDLVRLYARMGAKDPARAAACEGWLKNHLKMQLPAFAAGLAQFAAENAKLAEALGEQKAYLNENTGSQGAFGVPQNVEAEIFRVIEDNSVVRRVARRLAVSTKRTALVNVASNVTTYVLDELGASITAGEPTFGSATLNVKDYVAYGNCSIDVLQDEVVGLLNFFATNAGEMIAAKEDNLALEGTTTDTVVGLGSQTTTNVYTVARIYTQVLTSATNSPQIPTLAQFSNAIYGMAQKSSRIGTSAFFMRPGTWGAIASQVTTSFPLIGPAGWFGQPAPQDPRADGSLFGYPVYCTPQIATSTAGSNIYFGDFKNMVFGDRTGVDFGITDAEKFQYGLISLRVIKRTGIVVANAHAFSMMQKATY